MQVCLLYKKKAMMMTVPLATTSCNSFLETSRVILATIDSYLPPATFTLRKLRRSNDSIYEIILVWTVWYGGGATGGYRLVRNLCLFCITHIKIKLPSDTRYRF